MDATWQELRYSIRRLTRAPGFSLIAIATLALGIGANTAIFSFVNALLFKPPAHVHEPDQLVTVFTADFSSSIYSASSFPDYQDFAAQRDVFAGLAAFVTNPINVAQADRLQRLSAEITTNNYFSMLGMRPVAGRFFTPSDEAGDVIVLSEDVWRSRFGGERSLIGQPITVNARPYTLIGIAPAGFTGFTTGARADAWLPIAASAHITGSDITRDPRGDRGIGIIGRLQPGQTVAGAQARLDVLRQRLFSEYKQEWTNLRGQPRELTVLGEREGRVPPDQRGGVFTVAGLLLGAVAFVLLVCCANLANLLLARSAGREREFAIRYSMGARRGRILRQMMIESALLALMGGAAGLLVAVWSTDLFTGLQSLSALPTFFNTTPDIRVLLFTLAVSLITGILFGIAPAIQSTRVSLAGMLKSERAMGRLGRSHVRDALAATQIAIALVLAIGAGLIARTLQKASNVDVGFNAENIVVAGFDLRTQGYGDAREQEFYRQLETRLAAHPDVAGVTFARRIPLVHRGRRNVDIPGYQPQQGEEMEFPFNVVAPNYFQLTQHVIVRGRAFEATDRPGGARAIIVNETFARKFWGEQDPVGRATIVGIDTFRVVGVARDGKYWSIQEEPRPYFYLNAAQTREPMILHVKTRGNPAAVQEAVRATVRQFDAQLPVLTLDTMEGQMMNALLTQRIVGGLVGLFAVLAVLLASIGVYGVTSVLVVQRIPEIGLRIALGASRRDVLRLIVGRSALVALIGISAGLLLAALATRGLGPLLFNVSRFDPMTYALAGVALAGAATLASYLPARRALRIDPVVALKQ